MENGREERVELDEWGWIDKKFGEIMSFNSKFKRSSGGRKNNGGWEGVPDFDYTA